MEFPNLGQHCQEETCNRLDFLPFKCDSCKKVLCKDHINYAKHKCDSNNLNRKDFQIPLCPLCNQPVPYKRNELPDNVMSAHIDRDCKSDPAEERRRKIFSNKCSLKGCKQKELIPFLCHRCNKNYCIRHRLENDHECDGPESKGAAKNDINSKRLLFFQQQQQKPTQPPPQQQKSKAPSSQQQQQQRIQPNSMSEKEALEYAMRLSLMENSNESTRRSNNRGVRESNEPTANETEDEMLARALALSEIEFNKQQQQQQPQEQQQDTQKDNSCLIQ